MPLSNRDVLSPAVTGLQSVLSDLCNRHASEPHSAEIAPRPVVRNYPRVIRDSKRETPFFTWLHPGSAKSFATEVENSPSSTSECSNLPPADFSFEFVHPASQYARISSLPDTYALGASAIVGVSPVGKPGLKSLKVRHGMCW